jgi:hypothetical protein
MDLRKTKNRPVPLILFTSAVAEVMRGEIPVNGTSTTRGGRQDGKVTPELEGRSSKSGEIAAVHGVRQPRVDLRQELGHGG